MSTDPSSHLPRQSPADLIATTGYHTKNLAEAAYLYLRGHGARVVAQDGEKYVSFRFSDEATFDAAKFKDRSCSVNPRDYYQALEDLRALLHQARSRQTGRA